MESVLVTGAAGFIGYNLVCELVNKDYMVYALVEKSDSNGITKLNKLNNVTIIDDFSKLQKSESLPVIKTIYHLATVGVRPDFDDISLFCDINIKMACQLVDFAKENNTELIVNFGSCFEYGNHGNKLLSEEDECYPESLYAISKNASVKLTTQYAKQKKVRLITVRPFGVFGEGEGYNRLAPQVIRSGLSNQKLQMTAGEQVRDFVNVKDVVKSIITLAESDKKDVYEIYNICSSNPVRVREFIEEIIELCGFDNSLYQFGALPYRNNEAMVFAGDNTKLLDAIDYHFPSNHEEGIRRLFELAKEEMKNHEF